MLDTEEYFPRGGKKPAVSHFKQNNNFLGAPEKRDKKQKKVKRKLDTDDGYLSDEESRYLSVSSRNCATGLSYKTVKPGVLILGRVSQVLETKVHVMLPCQITGSVMACHISEPYNRLLEAYVNDQTDKVLELSRIFRTGQYVALKVLEVEENHLMLSMMPEHVNGGKTLTDVHKGALFQAAVSSVEDHGYVMDLGIPNIRVFLPKKNANPEVEIDTGVLTWCVVKSVAPSSDGSVVTVSSELAALQQAVLRKKPLTPLLPATAVDFTVDTPLDNGIEGHVFDDMTAYIRRQHADTIKGKKPALGRKVRARVLFVMPTRNTPFLMMKNIFETTYPDLEQEQKLREGDIVEEAQVLKITGRSIIFKLGKGSIGNMSLKRIQVDEDLTDEEVVAKSYPIGSIHKVRVICYNLCDYAYSVSDQPSILNEKYFNLTGLSVGDIVDGSVKAINSNHIVITVGRVTGYVPHTHYTDAGIFIDPKKASTSMIHKMKYKVGQEVKARVLIVDPQKKSLILTMKPSLLASSLELLTCYEDAAIGKAYIGVIKYIKDYILVSFFNNVIAFVPRSYVTKEPLDNLTQAFHLGQIVNCTILKVDLEAKKMTGSLVTVPFWPAKKREKPVKRKHDMDIDDSSKKKLKLNDEPTDKKRHKKNDQCTEDEVSELQPEPKQKKKKDKIMNDQETKEDEKSERKKKKNEKNLEEGDEEQIEVKKKRDKKHKVDEEDKKMSEESDAIETDIYEDSDQVLTPQDLGLIDMTDCETVKQFKKRVAAIRRVIATKTKTIEIIEKKIANIEEKGLDSKNKKFHTAMHSEKLTIEQQIEKLTEAMKLGGEKLTEMGCQYNDDYKKAQKEKKIAERKKQAEERKLRKSQTKDSQSREDAVVKDKKQKKPKDINISEKDDDLEPALDIPSAKEFWSATIEPAPVQEESSSSDDEKEDQPKKKRKKLTVAEKLAKVREEEEHIRQLERRALESSSQPASVEQFERALLASPNSSQLWIAYMAFHLQATEIDKARAIGRKALNTISFREEQEKLNVWLAMINFENRFGTKESQSKTLEEALQMNEPYQVHSKLLDIYVETGKQQELAGLVDLMTRKYKRQAECYTASGAACYKLGLVEKARQVMQKAMVVLEKKEHVSVLVQFALLERSFGSHERAEALFEQVLAVYPQRVDVCSAYIDMLVKGGDIEQVRQVMERMTSQKLPARKMKVLFKKWIEVEEKCGSADQVESIRQRAVDYVEKAKF